jgi:spermidine/putrescine transport system permease protein
MVDHTAPAPALGEVQLTLYQRMRAIFLRYEPLRGFSLLSPTLGIMLLALALPVGLLGAYSFWTQNYLDIDHTLTIANYLKFFKGIGIEFQVPGIEFSPFAITWPIGIDLPIYPSLLLKSMRISGLVTIATVLLAYPMAYFIAFRVTRHKMIWLILITIPFWTSYLLRVFAWKIILGYNGVINSGLMSLGVIDEPISVILYNPNAVILTLAHAWAAFAILPIYVSLEKIDRSLLEAATDLGDGPMMRFLRVTLPLSMPGVIAASLLVFIPTVGDYVTPKLVGGTTGIMIGNIIQSQFGKANNWPMGAALSIISMLVITALICAFLWFTNRARKRVA